MTEYATYGGVTHPQIESHPRCKECGKEIWGITKIVYTIGVEFPINLHTVCYERLLENAGADK